MMKRAIGKTIAFTRVAVLALLFGARAWGADCTGATTGFVPLTELGTGVYLGQFEGGLYPDGSNDVPAAHASLGLNFADQIHPLNPSGNSDPNGQIVLLSIGMSNAAAEFGRFAPDAALNSDVNHATLSIVNGAQGGATAEDWAAPSLPAYDQIRDFALAGAGLTEAQVQVVWVKLATGMPEVSLPDAGADAFTLVAQMGDAARAIRTRYPNVKLAFFASRIYAGYADTLLNPEPFAYETGFAAKWLIEAQIRQMNGEGIDPAAGNLAAGSAAPWLAWGPYLWADGTMTRDDGLSWECSDFASDGTHPAAAANEKVSALLMDFFLNSVFAAEWFRAADAVPQTNVIVSDPSPNFIQAGSPLLLRAPASVAYEWRRDNQPLSDDPPRLSGSASRDLVFQPVLESDAGLYTVRYEDGTKAIVESEPLMLTVLPAGSLPAHTRASLVVLLGLLLILSVRIVRRT